MAEGGRRVLASGIPKGDVGNDTTRVRVSILEDQITKLEKHVEFLYLALIVVWVIVAFLVAKVLT